MKQNNMKRIATALAVVGATAFSGCGSNNNNQIPPPIGGYPGQPIGYGSCIPLTTPQIGFTANGIYWDGRNLKAGSIPGGQAYGQVLVGGGGAGGPYTRDAVDAYVSINILQGAGYGAYPPTGYPPTGYPPTGYPPTGYPPTGYPPTGYPPTGVASTANATGMITLKPATVQVIMAQYGYSGGYPNTGYPTPGYPTTGYPPTTYPTYPGSIPQPGMPQYGAPCVSGLAIDTGWSPTANMLFSGYVYLYMNNTPHGVSFPL